MPGLLALWLGAVVRPSILVIRVCGRAKLSTSQLPAEGGVGIVKKTWWKAPFWTHLVLTMVQGCEAILRKADSLSPAVSSSSARGGPLPVSSGLCLSAFC